MIAIFTEHQTLTLPQHEKQYLTNLFATEIRGIPPFYDLKAGTRDGNK